jgi:hypothetical protein
LIGALAALALASQAPAHGCTTVHGRMQVWNGNPAVRISVIGSKRVLGVVQQDERFDDLPEDIHRAWRASGQGPEDGLALFGDFEVCAETPSRPGRMQMVRVVGGQRLVARRLP